MTSWCSGTIQDAWCFSIIRRGGTAMAQRKNAAQGTFGRSVSESVCHDWHIYRGTGRPPHDINPIELLPAPPPWRVFDGGPLPESDPPPEDDGETNRRLGTEFHLTEEDVDGHEVDMVNAALHLRR